MISGMHVNMIYHHLDQLNGAMQYMLTAKLKLKTFFKNNIDWCNKNYFMSNFSAQMCMLLNVVICSMHKRRCSKKWQSARIVVHGKYGLIVALRGEQSHLRTYNTFLVTKFENGPYI